jgi:transglutaminase-like putative cysteine protease
LEETFRQWTAGRDAVQARINIYEKVRDIPYAVLPELNSPDNFADILTMGRGSCTPKHLLLSNMFQRLGLMVLFAVYPFYWGDSSEVMVGNLEPIREMAAALPMSHHLACRVEIDGRLVLVDATLDLPLGKSELVINREWDGFSDTLLPMTPCGEEQLYHPSEVHLMEARSGQRWLEFYTVLNACLEKVRQS